VLLSPSASLSWGAIACEHTRSWPRNSTTQFFCSLWNRVTSKLPLSLQTIVFSCLRPSFPSVCRLFHIILLSPQEHPSSPSRQLGAPRAPELWAGAGRLTVRRGGGGWNQRRGCAFVWTTPLGRDPSTSRCRGPADRSRYAQRFIWVRRYAGW